MLWIFILIINKQLNYNMQKQHPIFKKQFNKPFDKENIAKTLNNLPREKANMIVPRIADNNYMHVQCEFENKRIARKYTLDTYKNYFSRSSQNLSSTDSIPDFTIPKIPQLQKLEKFQRHQRKEYGINELENHNLIKNYSQELLQSVVDNNVQRPFHFLEKHEINSTLRAKMIDWMIEVFSSYKCEDRTFFRAVKIMDRYFRQTKMKQEIKDLHLIGVTSIFLSAKLQQIYPLKLKTIYEKIAHKKLSMQAIQEKQNQFLHLFDFNIISVSLLDAINILFHTLNQSSWNLEIVQNGELSNEIEKNMVYIGKMVMYEYNILAKYNQNVIAAAIIINSLRMSKHSIQEFQIQQYMEKLMSTVNLNKYLIDECSIEILNLMKNFDRIFPNLTNFKKYNRLNLLEGRKSCQQSI